MFGPRFSSLFTSRWMAILWGILICLSAIEFVGTDAKNANGDKGTASAQTDATGQPIKSEDVTALRQAFEGN